MKAVVLHDTSEAQLQDLSAQFYLTEGNVGTNRAAACKDKLQELNTAVAVSASSAELTESFISQFQVCIRGNGDGCVACGRRIVVSLLEVVFALTGGSLHQHPNERVDIC